MRCGLVRVVLVMGMSVPLGCSSTSTAIVSRVPDRAVSVCPPESANPAGLRQLVQQVAARNIEGIVTTTSHQVVASPVDDRAIQLTSFQTFQPLPEPGFMNGESIETSPLPPPLPPLLPPLLPGWTDFSSQSDEVDDGACIMLPESERPRISFCNDFKTAPIWGARDLRSIPTWENALFLTAAAGGAVLLRNHLDDQVDQNISSHGSYWGGASRVLNRAGEAVVHIPLLASMYSYSLYSQNDDLHELTLALFTSYKFTAISTLGLQYATESRHGHYGGLSLLTDSGFPSMPASTSFAMAAVVDQKYGWHVGLPAYLGAGLIGWAGIDQHQHHVSDAAFGAALGYAIGRSIGGLHYQPDARFKLVPFIDTRTGAQGMQIEQQF